MVVGETTCDGKKKTWEILSEKVNFQVMEVPRKKRRLIGNCGAKRWMIFVRRWKNFLEKIGEHKVSRNDKGDERQKKGTNETDGIEESRFSSHQWS